MTEAEYRYWRDTSRQRDRFNIIGRGETTSYYGGLEIDYSALHDIGTAHNSAIIVGGASMHSKSASTVGEDLLMMFKHLDHGHKGRPARFPVRKVKITPAKKRKGKKGSAKPKRARGGIDDDSDRDADHILDSCPGADSSGDSGETVDNGANSGTEYRGADDFTITDYVVSNTLDITDLVNGAVIADELADNIASDTSSE